MSLNYVSLSPMCTGTHLLIISFLSSLYQVPKQVGEIIFFFFTIYTLIAFSPPKKIIFHVAIQSC